MSTPCLHSASVSVIKDSDAQSPEIEALQRKALVGIAVSLNQTPERVKQFVEKHGLPGDQFFDNKGNATGAYDVPATSYVVIINKAGKVVYTGSSNFAGWHVARAQETAHARHALGLVSEQSLYNLSARSVELELLPACKHYGLGVIPWSPLAGGLLGGVLKKQAATGRRAKEPLQKKIEKHKTQLEQYERFCGELGEETSNVALAWLLSNDAVSAPIIGPRTKEQLDLSLRALEIPMTKEISARLDQIWPGPGGAAPEAYAW